MTESSRCPECDALLDGGDCDFCARVDDVLADAPRASNVIEWWEAVCA